MQDIGALPRLAAKVLAKHLGDVGPPAPQRAALLETGRVSLEISKIGRRTDDGVAFHGGRPAARRWLRSRSSRLVSRYG
jgi:hypothetical protein